MAHTANARRAVDGFPANEASNQLSLLSRLPRWLPGELVVRLRPVKVIADFDVIG